MTIKLTTILLGVAILSVQARANVRDGKPWEWDDFETHVENVGKSQESVCDRVVDALGKAKLKCVIDRDSWNKFLEGEMKKPDTKRRDALSPWNCGHSFGFFRSYSDNEHMPDNTGDGAPVIEELKTKLSTLRCVKDDSDKPRFLTYDAKTKTLTFHITNASADNDFWVGKELKKLKSDFPAINKYWDDGHNM